MLLFPVAYCTLNRSANRLSYVLVGFSLLQVFRFRNSNNFITCRNTVSLSAVSLFGFALLLCRISFLFDLNVFILQFIFSLNLVLFYTTGKLFASIMLTFFDMANGSITGRKLSKKELKQE